MRARLKKIGPRSINKIVRFSRKVYFNFLNFLGTAAFNFLRWLGVLPKIKEFSKDEVNKILLIRLDRIGDVVLSTPAIRAVRETFPKVEIHLLLSEYTKDLLINHPNINKLLIYRKDTIGKDYDLTMALHPGFTPNLLAFKSGAKYRLGYSGCGGGFFLTHKLADDREIRIRHEVDSALEVVGMVGCSTTNKDLEISVTDKGEEFAKSFFQENNLKSDSLVVAIHPGARQEYIRWKKESFAEVADRLINEDKASVILIGSEEERKLVNEVVSLMRNKPLLAVGLKLTQLISVIKRCRLFIGNSTGPMHIAAALKVPVVAIFGNIHPLDSYQEWGPWGEGHTVVSLNLDCPDCHPSDCQDFKCIKLISSERVFDTVKKQLQRIK